MAVVLVSISQLLSSPGRTMYPCVHDTIQTILTSGQKECACHISLMSFFVFGSVKL